MDKKRPIPSLADIRRISIQRVLKLDVAELPGFPPVMARILGLSESGPESLKDIARLVQTDPGISVNVLRIVNSAFYGLAGTITTIPDAVVYLGFDEVRKLALSVAVFERIIKKGKQKAFDRIFFWRHCLSVAVLSKSIAREIQYPRPEEAYICGLLHDIGKIFFDLAGRADYSDFIRDTGSATNQAIKEERLFMGMGHDDLGACYAAEWHLPEPVVLAAMHHHRRYGHLDLTRDEKTLISIISLANFLAWTQGMGSVDVNRPPVLQPEVEQVIDMGRIDFKKIVQHMDREMAATSEFYNFIFPSAGQLRENLLKANLKLSRINTAHYYPEDHQTGPAGRSGKIRESITAPHRSLNPGRIIQGTLKAVHRDFGFNRIYVLRAVKTRRCLKVTEFLDKTGTGTHLAAVEIPINRNAGGFIRCLRHQEPVMITGKTSGEKSALNTVRAGEMLIVPFSSHKKVIGVLGMDTYKSGKAVPPEIFSLIAIVASELGMAMEHAIAYKEARAVSRQDGLTGLLNRMAVDELLARSFRKAAGKKHHLSLVMIDVDFFKKFNDRFGHQTGDSVLKLIAGTLKKLTRPFDHVGRYGGEEFIVILNNTSLKKAMIYAERIRKAIERLGQKLSDRFPGLHLTVSAGVAHYHKGLKNRDQLISDADKALYRAKETGRNRVAAAGPFMMEKEKCRSFR